MLWIAIGAAAVAGTIGWFARGARNNSGETRIDWKTRLAARDHDLLEAREQLAASAASAQEAVARAHGAMSEAAELRGELDSLREHAYERDREIERLEELVIELKAGSGEPDSELVATRIRLTEVETELATMSTTRPLDGTDLDAELAEAHEHIAELEARLAETTADVAGGGRLEELEAELATLQSHQCPDPDAHRLDAQPVATIEPASPWSDDLDDIADDAPLAPVVSLRPLGDDGAAEASQPAIGALLTDAPLFDEALYAESGDETAVEGPSDETDVAPAVDAEPDDLTEIKGIGPQIGSMLNRMGIVSFRDLAALADLGDDELSEMFNGLANRLRNGEWIATARSLHAAKYGETV